MRRRSKLNDPHRVSNSRILITTLTKKIRITAGLAPNSFKRLKYPYLVRRLWQYVKPGFVIFLFRLKIDNLVCHVLKHLTITSPPKTHTLVLCVFLYRCAHTHTCTEIFWCIKTKITFRFSFIVISDQDSKITAKASIIQLIRPPYGEKQLRGLLWGHVTSFHKARRKHKLFYIFYKMSWEIHRKVKGQIFWDDRHQEQPSDPA